MKNLQLFAVIDRKDIPLISFHPGYVLYCKKRFLFLATLHKSVSRTCILNPNDRSLPAREARVRRMNLWEKATRLEFRDINVQFLAIDIFALRGKITQCNDDKLFRFRGTPNNLYFRRRTAEIATKQPKRYRPIVVMAAGKDALRIRE